MVKPKAKRKAKLFAASTDPQEGGISVIRRLRGGDQAPLGEPPSSASRGGTFTFATTRRSPFFAVLFRFFFSPFSFGTI